MADPFPARLLDAANLLAEAPEVGKPGTNWKQVTPEHRRKIGPIVRHYMKEAHPFGACVRDNTKRFGAERARRVCAVVKDMGERSTKWRKGRSRLREEWLAAELWTVGTEAGLSEGDFEAWAEACVEIELSEARKAPDAWRPGLFA